MKYLVLMLLIVLSFSCQKEMDRINSAYEPFVGTWTWYESEFTNSGGPNSFMFPPNDQFYLIEFTEDRRFLSYWDGAKDFEMNISYMSFGNGAFTINGKAEDEIEWISFTIINDTSIIYQQNEKIPLEFGFYDLNKFKKN